MDVEKIKKMYLEEKCSIKEIADKLGLSFWTTYNLMKKNDIPRRNFSQASYVSYDKYKPKFLAKNNLDFKGKSLKIAGLMLYWAEGAKDGATVDFANSNPLMIKIFLRFLREICGISEDRIRIYLYAFSDQDIEGLKRYWSKITHVSLSKFIKPYIREVNPDLKDRRMPYGVIHIRYNDKRLLNCINDWLREYVRRLS